MGCDTSPVKEVNQKMEEKLVLAVSVYPKFIITETESLICGSRLAEH